MPHKLFGSRWGHSTPNLPTSPPPHKPTSSPPHPIHWRPDTPPKTPSKSDRHSNGLKSPPFKPSSFLPSSSRFRKPTPPPEISVSPPISPPFTRASTSPPHTKLPKIITFAGKYRNISPASAASDLSFFCVDARNQGVPIRGPEIQRLSPGGRTAMSPVRSPSNYGTAFFRAAGRDSGVVERRDGKAGKGVVRKAASVQSMRGRIGSVDEERGKELPRVPEGEEMRSHEMRWFSQSGESATSGQSGHVKRGSEGCCLNCRLRPVLGEERVLCRKCQGGVSKDETRRMSVQEESLANKCYSCLTNPKLDDGLGLCKMCSPIYGGHFVTIDQYPMMMSPIDSRRDQLTALEEMEEPMSATSEFTVSAYMRDSFVARYR